MVKFHSSSIIVLISYVIFELALRVLYECVQNELAVWLGVSNRRQSARVVRHPRLLSDVLHDLGPHQNRARWRHRPGERSCDSVTSRALVFQYRVTAWLRNSVIWFIRWLSCIGLIFYFFFVYSLDVRICFSAWINDILMPRMHLLFQLSKKTCTINKFLAMLDSVKLEWIDTQQWFIE